MGHHLGDVRNEERTAFVFYNFLVGLFTGEVELVAPPGGMYGNYKLQTVELSGSREEGYTEAARWSLGTHHVPQ